MSKSITTANYEMRIQHSNVEDDTRDTDESPGRDFHTRMKIEFNSL